MQELAARSARAPDGDVALAALLRVVELAHQRRQDVRARQIEVVVRAVQVRRHRRDEVAAVLRAVRLAQLDAGDLRDRVGFVGRLERAGQQVLFLDRLRAFARVDARAAEVEQLLHAVHVRRVHHGRVNHHVVVDELGRARRVRHDPADRAGDEEDVLRPVRAEPVVHRRLVAQVELIAGGGQDVAEAFRLEPAHERRPDEAAMPGDEDASGLIHVQLFGVSRSDGAGFGLEAQQALHAIDDARLLGTGRIDLREDVEAFRHGRDDADAEAARRGRQRVLVVAPDEDRARARVGDDVEAVFRAVVDDEVEIRARRRSVRASPGRRRRSEGGSLSLRASAATAPARWRRRSPGGASGR